MVEIEVQPRRIELEINEVKIRVYQFVKENSYQNYLDMGCIKLGKGVFVSATLSEAIRVCGLNEYKIDFAIPQQYFDNYIKVFGEPPKLMWDYNTNFFGYPLFREEVIERFKSIVRIRLMEHENL